VLSFKSEQVHLSYKEPLFQPNNGLLMKKDQSDLCDMIDIVGDVPIQGLRE
jgi:hypothetical protein